MSFLWWNGDSCSHFRRMLKTAGSIWAFKGTVWEAGDSLSLFLGQGTVFHKDINAVW